MNNLVKFVMAVALSITGVQAQAILLSPGDEIDSGAMTILTPATSTNLINAYIESTYGVIELYKDNVGGIEEGAFAGSYETTFSNSTSDPSDALIEYVSGDSIYCPECYLLVKDGNHDPYWYLFDIGTWNGVDSIELSGFWPNGGAISHLSIYGDRGNVPEPAPLALLALGLIGIGLRKLKKIRLS